MKPWLGPAMVAALLAGVAGFAVGWSAARRAQPQSPPTERTQRPAASKPSKETPGPAGPTVAPATTPPVEIPTSVVKTEAPPASGKDRLFALALPMLSEKERFSALWNVFLGNKDLQGRLFDALMATDDAGVLEAGQDLLISIRDPELLKRIVAAFDTESNPDRKAMLAYAAGANFNAPDAQGIVERILTGADVRLQERALVRMSVQEVQPDVRDRVTPQLRNLVLNGASVDVRSRAAGALRGDVSEDGVRFLIDRVLKDPEPAVQLRALQALPGTWRSPAPLPEEHLSTYWTVVNDESRSRDVRSYAAGRLLHGGLLKPNQITEDQKALLKSLTEKKN